MGVSTKDVIDRMVQNYGPNLTKTAASEVVECFVTSVSQLAKEEGRVQINKLGIFTVSDHAERAGRNPKTGETLTIPARKVPNFKASKALKEFINA